MERSGKQCITTRAPGKLSERKYETILPRKSNIRPLISALRRAEKPRTAFPAGVISINILARTNN